MLELERKRRANEQTEKRELQSLERAFQNERRTQGRRGYEHMPSMHLGHKPPGRPSAPHKAMNRYGSNLSQQLRTTATPPDPRQDPPKLHRDFSKAAAEDGKRRRGDGGGQSPHPDNSNDRKCGRCL